MMLTLPTVQIICITMCAMLNFVSYYADTKFEKDCEDGGSDTIGIASRAMNMVILLLWRIMNITFVIIFIRYAQEFKKEDTIAMEKDFKKAFAIEDDEVYEDSEEYDEETEEDDEFSYSGASSAISRKK